MKVFIISGVMLMLISINVQASTIVLKNGRTVIGEIIQQDKAKVIVNVDDTSLTYYRDEIVSITDSPVTVKNDDAGVDPEKEKLIEQYLSIVDSSNVMVTNWVQSYVIPGKQQIALATLNNDQNIRTLDKMRIRGLARYLTTADLKAVINFISTPEGKKFYDDMRQYYIHVASKMFIMLEQQSKEIAKLSRDDFYKYKNRN